MLYPFSIIAAIAGKKRQAQPLLSLKEAMWVFAAGVMTFAGLMLAFWLTARSALL